jgi:hypothetical protein
MGLLRGGGCRRAAFLTISKVRLLATMRILTLILFLWRSRPGCGFPQRLAARIRRWTRFARRDAARTRRRGRPRYGFASSRGTVKRHTHRWGAGQNSSVVARDCILLYRGFAIRRPLANPASVENPAPSRLEIGDTADLEICATKNFAPRPGNFRVHLGIVLVAQPSRLRVPAASRCEDPPLD